MDASLGEIVPRLLKAFSSREGYKLFDDSIPTCTSHYWANGTFELSWLWVYSAESQEHEHPYCTGQQHGCTDECVRFSSLPDHSGLRCMLAGAVIEDLELIPHLDVVLLSEEEGVEKPSPEIFRRAYERVGAAPDQTVHVGDELDRYVHTDTQHSEYTSNKEPILQRLSWREGLWSSGTARS